ncbi:MAG: hypothetical protein KA296_06880 [Marinobacter sp.]|nr:hypothetical protein [Marinobacter sp.]
MNELRSTTLATLLTQYPDGVKGRYLKAIAACAFAESPQPFFIHYFSEGRTLKTSHRGTRDFDAIFLDPSERSFPLAVEYTPFNSITTINLVHQLQHLDLNAVAENPTKDIDTFFNIDTSQSERGSDVVRVSVDKTAYFVESIQRAIRVIDTFSDLLVEYEITDNPRQTSNNLSIALAAIDQLEIKPNVDRQSISLSRKFPVSVTLNEDFATRYRLPVRVEESSYHIISNIITDYFIKAGFYKYFQDAAYLMQLLEYANTLKANDTARQGQFPQLLNDNGRGLYFELKDFHHPLLLDRDEYSFKSESFGNFSLGYCPESGQGEVIAILPSPNMSGKSTFMKAVALILHSACMGRKVSASSCRMTIPDRIFSNFGVEESLEDGISLFKAQLINIRCFMENGTRYSLGLFDELFSGTSSDYQLCIIWAFLELCHDNNLRVIISTHNKDAKFFSEPDGYQKIKGAYKRGDNSHFTGCGNRSKTISINKHRKVVDGSHNDSEALSVVHDVFADDYPKLVTRCRDIYEHIYS